MRRKRGEKLQSFGEILRVGRVGENRQKPERLENARNRYGKKRGCEQCDMLRPSPRRRAHRFAAVKKLIGEFV